MERHDRASSPVTLEGIDWLVQVVPFHESATLMPPTASQKLAETHDTPLSQSTFEGRVWLVQVEPFHESATPV